MERNRRIFEDYRGVGLEELWLRVKYLANFSFEVNKRNKIQESGQEFSLLCFSFLLGGVVGKKKNL